ncbi:ABC transporter, periplasmic substrate-binding protein [Syntrophotalea carbinolica DSM 2380]|uniref:ABC transporter, periplasmic substrate-binding protein n=1 Tax=Syntrophotalea carbinolica (strain DSM 2380 / NBRC 103641 / GraBd1) TaxID=338963 RepID=Q3A5U4_SYNC1|nr:PhnD/SsuA/transferrin family substrate-binding protein [Syntrophotalea carbinolica]ABA88263.1 ABC transporter, periplasmic substrate-binding protein [Syntrophotalea carbinolica DSM 2380]
MLLKNIRFFLIYTFCLLPVLLTPLTAAADQTPLTPVKLTFAFVSRAFLGFNALDMETALKVFVRDLGRQWGFDVQTEVQRFENAQQLENIAPANRPDLILVDSWTYLDVTDGAWMEPLFVTSEEGDITNTYLLLTRGGKIKNVSELRGKPINVLTTTNANLGIHWLSVYLRDHKMELPETFFGELTFSNDPMQAILPVFFGKKDAVVTNSKQLKLMTELNPQLGKLVPLAVSAPLVNNIICLKRSGWKSEDFRQHLIQGLPDLHLAEMGSQILLLFRVQKLEKFTPSCLESVRRMHKNLPLEVKNFLLQAHNPR